MAGTAVVPGGRAMVSIFDGTRQPFADGRILITVTDGNLRIVSREFHDQPATLFSGLQLFGNAGDNYTFLAAAHGYKDAGFFPVHISGGVVQPVNLMLIPDSNEFSFDRARWNRLDARPKLKSLFRAGAPDEDAAEQRYSDLEDRDGGEILACLLNICAAAEQIFLPTGTVLDCFKQVIWDLDGASKVARDRFYAWADRALIDQLETAKAQGKFVAAPHGLHPGATRSYKQVEFGEANLQLTFHENDASPAGTNWVKVEPDIDYFRDTAAHLLLEVAVNALGSVTDPRAVYALRWIAGQRAGIPEFDPLYTIVRV